MLLLCSSFESCAFLAAVLHSKSIYLMHVWLGRIILFFYTLHCLHAYTSALLSLARLLPFCPSLLSPSMPLPLHRTTLNFWIQYLLSSSFLPLSDLTLKLSAITMCVCPWGIKFAFLPSQMPPYSYWQLLLIFPSYTIKFIHNFLLLSIKMYLSL